MKEINMTKAISCMPDKFITMEMVELAATEHRPELVNYLPEKYITSEILDSIFKVTQVSDLEFKPFEHTL